MPRTKTIYECKYCGKEFVNYWECEECEQSHIRDYSDANTEEIIDALNQISDSAYGYHIGGEVMGMLVTNFESLMKEAAIRLGKSSNLS